MGVNLAEQAIKDDLFNRIKYLEDQLLELKTHPQPIGGDVLKVVSSQTVSTTLVLPAGIHGSTGFIWNLSIPFLTLFSPLFSVYVDGTTANDAYPYGSNMTSGKLATQYIVTEDESISDDFTGTRAYIVQLWNFDSVSHSYTIKHRLNYPILPLA